MAMSAVLKPGHLARRVLDLDAALLHYRDRMGLQEVERDAQGRVYLKGWDELDWVSEVPDFDLTEQVMGGDFMVGAFLSCSNKAHDLALTRHAERGELHRASFLLGSWEDVLRAADPVSMYDISIELGPTRHGITRGRTPYFFDPSGNRNEVFSGDYTWYPDHEPITRTADQIGRGIFSHDRKLNESFLSVVT